LVDQGSDLPTSVWGEAIKPQAATFPRFIGPREKTDGLDAVAVGGKREWKRRATLNWSNGVKTKAFFRNVEDNAAVIGLKIDIRETS